MAGLFSEVDSLPILTGRGVKTRLKGYEEEITKQQLELHLNVPLIFLISVFGSLNF